MVTLTTRAGKGSPLTHNEVDANFNNLNAALAWTQIGSATPTGTGTVTFSSIPQTYADLMVVFEGISHTTDSDSYAVYASGDNGSTWCTIAVTGSFPIGTTAYGGVTIANYRGNAGFVYGGAGNIGSDNDSNDADNPYPRVWRIAGGIDAIQIGTYTYNFDAGTIRLMGR